MKKRGVKFPHLLLTSFLAAVLLMTGAGQVCWSINIARADGGPTIDSTIPTKGATGVSIDTDIQVTFSESMNANATQGAFSILPVVSGVFTWEGANIMIFTPEIALAPGTLYTANVSTAATNLAGIHMDGDHVWSFTTVDIVSVTITDKGATGLNFGTLEPGDGIRHSEFEAPSITIKNDGSANITLVLKGSDFIDYETMITFGIDNAFYNDTNNSANATTMSDNYSLSPWKTLSPGTTLNIYHWLSIPNATPAGSYKSTFTYKTEEVL